MVKSLYRTSISIDLSRSYSSVDGTRKTHDLVGLKYFVAKLSTDMKERNLVGIESMFILASIRHKPNLQGQKSAHSPNVILRQRCIQ
jgi:hypothetical protein